VPEERLNEGIGMFGVTGLTGLAIGPVISEIIISKFGFSVFFLAATGMGAGTFFGSITLGYIGQWAGFQAVFFAAGLAVLIGLGVQRIQVRNSRQEAPYKKDES